MALRGHQWRSERVYHIESRDIQSRASSGTPSHSAALCMYSSMHSACTSHALSMHFACTPHALRMHSACTPQAISIQSACNQHAISMHVRFTQQRDHRPRGAQVRRRHATDGRKEPVGRGGRRGEHSHAAAFPNASSCVHWRRTCQGRERPPGSIRFNQIQSDSIRWHFAITHLPR